MTKIRFDKIIVIMIILCIVSILLPVKLSYAQTLPPTQHSPTTTISDRNSCLSLPAESKPSWNGVFKECMISGELTIPSGEVLKINSDVNFMNKGTIKLSGGDMDNYGSIENEGGGSILIFGDAIYDEPGGKIYNHGYISIFYEGSIHNMGKFSSIDNSNDGGRISNSGYILNGEYAEIWNFGQIE